MKWRPPLALVLGGTLAAVLGMPLIGFVVLRYTTPNLGWTNAVLINGCLVMVVTCGLWWLLWRLLVRPLGALQARAKGFRSGQADASPLPHYGTQEVAALGAQVLEMAAHLDNRNQTIRHFTNHVTHELKSPLTTLKGAMELLEDTDDSTTRARLLESMRLASGRMEVLLDGLRKLAAAREPAQRGAVTLAQLGLDGVQLSGADVVLPFSEATLRAVLVQLVRNAREAGAKTVEVRASLNMIEVVNDGPPIVDASKIFEPFYTTKRENGGTGMGLAIVQGLLAAQEGRIEVRPQGDGFVISHSI